MTDFQFLFIEGRGARLLARHWIVDKGTAIIPTGPSPPNKQPTTSGAAVKTAMGFSLATDHSEKYHKSPLVALWFGEGGPPAK